MIGHPIYELVPMNSAAEAIAALPPNATVSVTCSPVKGLNATFELAARLSAEGHAVIPHVSARLVTGAEHANWIAEWCRAMGVTSLFVIAGDAERALGPYQGGLELLQTFVGLKHGLTTIGVPGYPDGHSFIPLDVVDRMLLDKVMLIQAAGLNSFVSTQMCFNPTLISQWATQQRLWGMTAPIHLGVPGAIDRAKLITMGARLGIGASLRFLKKNRETIRQLVSPGSFDPLEIMEPLAPVAESLGITSLHLFTFNQVAATRAWYDTLVGSQVLQ